MRKTLKLLRLVLLSLPRVIFEYFQWILPYSRHPEKAPIEKRYAKARSLVVFILRNMHFDLRAEEEGILNVDKPCLFVANHVSAIDPLTLIALSKRPVSFIAKKEAKKIIVVGRFIRAIDGLFLDRSDAFQAVKLFRQAKANMEQENLSYAIFPEGTRTKEPYSGKLLPFHAGSLKIAYMAKAPIVTYAQFGSFHVLDKKPGPWHIVSILGLKRREYDDYNAVKSVDLINTLQEEIQVGAQKLIDADNAYYDSKENKKRPHKWWKDALKKGD